MAERKPSSFGNLEIVHEWDHFVYCENCNHAVDCPLEDAIHQAIKKAENWDKMVEAYSRYLGADRFMRDFEEIRHREQH